MLFVGAAIVSQSLVKLNTNKLNSTHNTSLLLRYTNNANNWATARNISIAGAAVVYLWNIIDGIAAKGKQNIIYGDDISLYPYSDINFPGITLSFKL